MRERLVDYLERRRAALSLPPLRTEMLTLGEKALAELKQMRLIEIAGNQVKLLPAGSNVVSKLKQGKGREARRLILGRMIDTFDNVYGLLRKLSPPSGNDIVLPAPRGASASPDAMDDSELDLRDDADLDLEQICTAWRDWCIVNDRSDLLPNQFVERATALFEKSTDRHIANRIKNVVQQLVLEEATDGIVSKMAIYRTLRDRLASAGALNWRIKVIEPPTIALESLYSCLHVGPRSRDAIGWIPLDVPRSAEPMFVHEPEPEEIVGRMLEELRKAAAVLRPRAGYYRIYELRDRICEALRISQGVFDSAFLHLYRSKQGEISLGVDYETITAKRLPLEVRDQGRSEFFNLVAFRQPT